jgi:hypothetical protein
VLGWAASGADTIPAPKGREKCQVNEGCLDQLPSVGIELPPVAPMLMQSLRGGRTYDGGSRGRPRRQQYRRRFPQGSDRVHRSAKASRCGGRRSEQDHYATEEYKEVAESLAASLTSSVWYVRVASSTGCRCSASCGCISSGNPRIAQRSIRLPTIGEQEGPARSTPQAIIKSSETGRSLLGSASSQPSTFRRRIASATSASFNGGRRRFFQSITY